MAIQHTRRDSRRWRCATACIVALAVGLTALFLIPDRRLLAADEAPDNGHLDPLQTVARFLTLTQSGKTGDVRAAARMIEPDRADLAWANDQLDSNSRDMLLTMHVFNLATILSHDPVVGPPTYALQREPPPPARPAPPLLMPTEDSDALDALLAAQNSPPPAPPPPPPPAPAAVTEAQAERATVKLESGRSIVLLKDPGGAWLFSQHSSSLQARAEWVQTRDRDLELPPSKQFADFYLDMIAHDPDYAWRVAMALGEAGRFADLSQLIQYPAPLPLPADADQLTRAAAEKARLADLEEQGRMLYSWLRRSVPRRIRRTASTLKLPTDPSKIPERVPAVDGCVADFLIWTTDHKRVHLAARQRPPAPDTIDLGVPIYEWVFDCDCYSPETKRAWIHAQRQALPDQP